MLPSGLEEGCDVFGTLGDTATQKREEILADEHREPTIRPTGNCTC